MTHRGINTSKKEAILQLVNFLCDSPVTEITELADGEILLKAIQKECPQFFIESSIDCHVEDVKSESNCDAQNEVEESASNKNTDNSFRFHCIQKFIDDCYGIKSSELISYDKCTEEFEIYKLTVFVLSEIVKRLIEIKQENLQTLYHLDVKYQVELEDCFKIFISEREKITKGSVEKLLSKSAVKSSPYLTPVRQSPRCKQKRVSPRTPKEDVFSSSPLKVYFESPVFKKEDILMKDREIKNLKKVLEEGDDESSELHHKLSECQKEIKKKDKLLQKLQEQITEMNAEIKVLQNSCQEKEKLADTYKIELDKSNNILVEQIKELRSQLNQMENEKIKTEIALEEERNRTKALSEERGISVPVISFTENDKLKEQNSYLKLKVYSLKKQLSEKVLAEVKAKESTGNLNKTYEDLWAELDKARKEDQETMASIIEEDNKQLCMKYNETLKKNRELLEKNEELLEKIKKIEEQASSKMLISVDTETDLSEFKIPEKEKLRKMHSKSRLSEDFNLSGGPSYILNNSDNFIESEQSVDLPKSKILPEKLSEAVLWKTCDIMPETENTDINFSRNSYLDVTSNLEIENTEPAIPFCQENEYIFGNLNFNVFLNELKKLTKNGSFQKVLQVFEKFRKTKEPDQSASIDIQELLKIITECICIVVSLNAKYISNVQDKCCSTDEDEFTKKTFPELQDKCCSTNEEEFPEKVVCQNCEKLKQELVESRKKMEKYEGKLEYCYNKYKIIEQELKKKDDYAKEEKESLRSEIERLKKDNSELIKKHRNLFIAFEDTKSEASTFIKKKNRIDNFIKLLKEQNARLKQDLTNKKKELKLKENTIKELLEKESDKTGTWNKESSSVGESSYFSVRKSHSNTSQDTANESTLSGAFNKNISHYVSENEDDFVYFNSLAKVDEASELRRVEELKRRNSLLPMHLQSAYPIEIQLNTNYDNLYVKNTQKYKEENCSKKRKLDALQEPSTSFLQNCKNPRKYICSTPKRLTNAVKKMCNNTHSMNHKK